MQFKELIEEVKRLKFKEVRKDAHDYFEAVVSGGELVKLIEVFQAYFGLPAYPSEKALSLLAKNVIDKFGGIRPNQTLYLFHDDKKTIFAMLWPWMDGEHATIKIFQE